MTQKHNGIERKTLIDCCGAHIIQDGLIALQYVLLPILAQLFSLNYTQVGLLRAVAHVAMSSLEIPAGVLAEKWGERRLLAFGLVCAGLGYLGLAYAPGFWLVAFCLLITGIGAGFQHSLSSALLVKVFESNETRRQALGTYNSAGDGGKLTFTALFSIGIGIGLAWNIVVVVLSLISIVFGIGVWKAAKKMEIESEALSASDNSLNKSGARDWGIKNPRRFSMLGITVFLDSAVQAVFLTFLAFILLDKGAGEALASAGVVIVLVGGMVGKFVCGFLAARWGDRYTFILIQGLTVLGILLLINLPLTSLLFALPFIGLVVQGTSTVTYGSAADFIEQDRQSRGYALIYTFSSVSSVAGPFLLGLMADYAGLEAAIWGMALLALMSIPLCFVLSQTR